MFNERQPTTPMTTPQVWHEYANVLYDIPGQPPLPQPHGSRPHKSTFFTLQNVRNAIDQLQFGKAQDHDGLFGEHFIYARDTLLPLLAHIFNRAMCKGFPTRWTKYTIVPILKSRDPMMPSNYRTIMIGHYFTKLYGLILESELSIWAKQNGCRSVRQAGFWKGFTTLDHILTLRTLIEEDRAHNKRIYCFFCGFLKSL